VCVLCSQLWIEDHWSDAAATAIAPDSDVVALETHAARRGQRLRDRAERVRLFNLILKRNGLSLQDWEGSSYILRDAKGRSVVINNLAQVWAEAERLLGRPIDPLDPDLVSAVQRQSAATR
jgi:hypothetical protein